MKEPAVGITTMTLSEIYQFANTFNNFAKECFLKILYFKCKTPKTEKVRN